MSVTPQEQVSNLRALIQRYNEIVMRTRLELTTLATEIKNAVKVAEQADIRLDHSKGYQTVPTMRLDRGDDLAEYVFDLREIDDPHPYLITRL